MSKHGWMLWLVPVGAWTVYMCWLSGYQNGYEQGHDAAWANARDAFMPATAQVDRSLGKPSFEYQTTFGQREQVTH